MKKFKSLKVAVLVFGLISISIQGFSQSEIWTLRDCIDYALDNNIQIKQSELASESNKTTLLQSKLNLLPSVNGSVSHSYGWGRSVDMATYEYTNQQTTQDYFSISGNVTIFNGLQKFNEIKKNQYEYLASKFDSDKMRDDVSLLIAAAYLQILFSHELVQTSRESVEVTKLQIDRTKKMVDAGTLAKGSLLDIQSQGAAEELNLINAENQLNLAYLDLQQFLDIEAVEDFVIDKPQLIIKKEPELIPAMQIYRYALTNLPEIKSAEYRLKSSEKSLAIAKGNRSPSLSLRAGWGTNYSDQITVFDPTDPNFGEVVNFGDQFNDNQNRTLSISLSIPIFNGYQVSTYISQSKLGIENSQYNLQIQKNQVRKNVEQAFADAVAAYKSFNATKKSLLSFSEAFMYMEKKFNVGMVNSIDYNVAKQLLTKAESALLSAKYNYIFKAKILDFYMSKPLSIDEYK
ncbi:MAG: TolC family protein [Bacteroidales bacterium]|nr:TolC family protein [Bacteroidales bacterium]